MYRLLACGSNGRYQLGLDHDEDVHELTEVKVDLRPGEDIAQISCGGNHTLLLTSRGRVLACGDNASRQCGVGGSEVVRFHEISSRCGHVVSGWEYLVLVCQDGVYVCGAGPKGELGLGPARCTDLTRLDFEEEVDDIRSGVSHVVLRDQKGRLWGWGTSRRGQLGNVPRVNGKRVGFLDRPTLLDFGVEVALFALGRDVTYVVDTSGSLHVFGAPAISQTIQGTFEPFVGVKSMWLSVHILQNHRIKSLGNNSHGQHFPDDEPVDDYAIGSEHGVVRRGNTVYAWGWGEHGNCGRQASDDVTFSSLNPIFTGNVALLACGCATTWVVESVD